MELMLEFFLWTLGNSNSLNITCLQKYLVSFVRFIVPKEGKLGDVRS